VTFFFDGYVVFRAWPKDARVALPQSFRFRAGRYRWTVQAMPVAPAAKPIVDSTFVLTAAAAAAANG
jgi:hypothetical protein